MIESSTSNPAAPNSRPSLTWRKVAAFVFGALLGPGALFAAAGRLDWPAAWAYTAVTLLAIVGSRVVVALRYPDLLAERGRFAEARNSEAWDRRLMPLVALLGPLLTSVVIGLDERFGWSPEVSLGVQVGAMVAVLLGYALAVWAMAVNRYFSAVVRIQRDRGHRVVSDGPYAHIRHPSYAGGILAYLAAGPALGSLWALVPATLLTIGLVVRTALEDRTLQRGLPGYEEYAARVRHRLVPRVW